MSKWSQSTKDTNIQKHLKVFDTQTHLLISIEQVYIRCFCCSAQTDIVIKRFFFFDQNHFSEEFILRASF